MKEEKQEKIKNDILQDVCLIGVCLLFLCVSYQHYLQVNFLLKIESNKLNITDRFNDSLLIFNRVPKAGTQTLNHVIGELRTINNFSAYTTIEGMPTFKDVELTYIEDLGMRIVTIESILKMKGAFLKHQNFLNFSEYDPNLKNPIYVNFVRDPIERIISWYYYIRNPLYQFDEDLRKNTTQYKPAISLYRMKMSLEDCLTVYRTIECRWLEGSSVHYDRVGSHSSQMTYFCGHLPICDVFNGEESLKMAMRNVDENFAAVGVLEEWDKSLLVFEKYVPKYFSNAVKVYKSGKIDKSANKNLYKPKVPDFVRTMIAKNLTREIEFYNFCKQRLMKQYLALL